MKCAHTVLPFITLVASTNKSVLHDVHNILEIGRNEKQYLNNVRMSELLTAVIQYNKCYYDTYYNHNNLYYQLHAFNFL